MATDENNHKNEARDDPRRCFLAWCTQFQITHVFLEAVIVLCASNFFKTCESLFGVEP